MLEVLSAYLYAVLPFTKFKMKACIQREVRLLSGVCNFAAISESRYMKNKK